MASANYRNTIGWNSFCLNADIWFRIQNNERNFTAEHRQWLNGKPYCGWPGHAYVCVVEGVFLINACIR